MTHIVTDSGKRIISERLREHHIDAVPVEITDEERRDGCVAKFEILTFPLDSGETITVHKASFTIG